MTIYPPGEQRAVVQGVSFWLGGADTIVINDMSGTDVTEMNINLAAAGGAGDGQADTIIINATSGDDVVMVTGDAAGVSVLGLATRINITGFEAALDRLVINLLGGDDVLEASGLAAGAIQLTGKGGNNHDVLIGGDGNDVLTGGDGDDVLIGGLGLDVIDGQIGDDVEIQLVADPSLYLLYRRHSPLSLEGAARPQTGAAAAASSSRIATSPW